MPEILERYFFHWTPERAIWLGGIPLSWDGRCAGIYAGFAIALLFQSLFCRGEKRLPPLALVATAAVLSLPMFIDVLTIHFQLRTPANSIRHLTGTLFGISFCCLLYPAARQLATRSGKSLPSSWPQILLIYVAGTGFSALTLWNNAISYYLLESLSWVGFTGMAITISAGLFRLLFPVSVNKSQ